VAPTIIDAIHLVSGDSASGGIMQAGIPRKNCSAQRLHRERVQTHAVRDLAANGPHTLEHRMH
jgi:hypothetical protein